MSVLHRLPCHSRTLLRALSSENWTIINQNNRHQRHRRRRTSQPSSVTSAAASANAWLCSARQTTKESLKWIKWMNKEGSANVTLYMGYQCHQKRKSTNHRCEVWWLTIAMLNNKQTNKHYQRTVGLSDMGNCDAMHRAHATQRPANDRSINHASMLKKRKKRTIYCVCLLLPDPSSLELMIVSLFTMRYRGGTFAVDDDDVVALQSNSFSQSFILPDIWVSEQTLGINAIEKEHESEKM